MAARFMATLNSTRPRLFIGIPTLLIHRRGRVSTPHAGGTPPEARVDVVDYASPGELYSVVHAWMSSRHAMILAGRIRRTRQLTATEPLRLEVRELWLQALPAERRRICDALLITEGMVEALVSNDLDFAAARTGLTLDLAVQMGIVRTKPPRDAQHAVAPSGFRKEELDGLEDAIDT
jgi:hypothetical protein